MLDAGHRPRSFFMAEKWLEGLRDVLERASARETAARVAA